jgi:hypothetical protein
VTMANQEHLDLLKQGRATWKEWRQNPGSFGELSNVDLSGHCFPLPK